MKSLVARKCAPRRLNWSARRAEGEGGGREEGRFESEKNEIRRSKSSTVSKLNSRRFEKFELLPSQLSLFPYSQARISRFRFYRISFRKIQIILGREVKISDNFVSRTLKTRTMNLAFSGCPGVKEDGPTSPALPVARVAAAGLGKRRDRPRGRPLPRWRSALPVRRRVKVASG